ISVPQTPSNSHLFPYTTLFRSVRQLLGIEVLDITGLAGERVGALDMTDLSPVEMLAHDLRGMTLARSFAGRDDRSCQSLCGSTTAMRCSRRASGFPALPLAVAGMGWFAGGALGPFRHGGGLADLELHQRRREEQVERP